MTIFIGENGPGKATLLETIAASFGFNLQSSGKNFCFATHAFNSALHQYLRLSKSVCRPKASFYLRATSFLSVATEIERLDGDLINAYGRRSLHEQSHSKSFLALIIYRFKSQGFYVLDKPEAALSSQPQLAALNDPMHERVGLQFIMATHSPILMAYPEATTYIFLTSGN